MENTSRSNEKRITQQEIDTLYKKVLVAVKTSNTIPSEDDTYNYHTKYTSNFKDKVHNVEQMLQQMIYTIISTNTEDENNNSIQLYDGIEPVNHLTDFVDTLLDNVSQQLENVSKISNTIQTKALENKPLQFHTKTIDNTHAARNYQSMTHQLSIAKPQEEFHEKIDNSTAPFICKLQIKVHAINDNHLSCQDDEIQAHPYYYEIQALQYSKWQLESSNNIFPKISIQDATYLYVNTKETLEMMMKCLNDQLKTTTPAIAVDLEHHSYRTYLGLVCLMQISTSTKDFIIDTLALRNELQVLNDIFCNPKILKVFHGADSDILWLQRDFGLYIVNLFDTGQAARVLQYPRYSLAYLLKKFINLDAAKQYQLADWRIRPLEDKMIQYAREDTRYLLYIYEHMKKELLQHSTSQLLYTTFEKSKEVCLQIYEKPQISQDDCFLLSEKLKSLVGITTYSRTQQAVFEMMYYWRDTIAREVDESIHYICPNHVMMKMVKFLPTTSQQLFKTCNPVPPYIRKHAYQLTQEISNLIAQNKDLENKVLNIVPEMKQSTRIIFQDEDMKDTSSPSTRTNTSDMKIEPKKPWLTGIRKAQPSQSSSNVSSGPFISAFHTNRTDVEIEKLRQSLDLVNQFVSQTTFIVSETTLDTNDTIVPTSSTISHEVKREPLESSLPKSLSEQYQISKRRLPSTQLNKTKRLKVDSSSVPNEDNIHADSKESIDFDYVTASANLPILQLNTSNEDQQHPMGYNPYVQSNSNTQEDTKKTNKGKTIYTKKHHMPKSSTFR